MKPILRCGRFAMRLVREVREQCTEPHPCIHCPALDIDFDDTEDTRASTRLRRFKKKAVAQ